MYNHDFIYTYYKSLDKKQKSSGNSSVEKEQEYSSCVFSPALINKNYGIHNEGIIGATLKLGDIIGELTGKTLTAWPSKGQLQASSLSLKYAVLHKAAIANLVPTSNNTNVSEELDRILTSAKLKPIGFPSLICSMLITQHPCVLKKEDGLGEDAKSLTISEKLMKGNMSLM
ncbi:hypothetical protein LIER_15253 [Lithospermum erythrorhizon]|uniref:Uncharacterized protein n=1 Tax=Lithospermum erythrorhizon TaxID=34254 RepID=A0AAV3Q350_LITER